MGLAPHTMGQLDQQDAVTTGKKKDDHLVSDSLTLSKMREKIDGKNAVFALRTSVEESAYSRPRCREVREAQCLADIASHDCRPKCLGSPRR